MSQTTIVHTISSLLMAAGVFGCINVEQIAKTEYPNGIYAVDEIELNNTHQWIYIRSAQKHNPVLLWLDGGPGGSELGWVEYYNKALENHFIVVNWDQRGTAKSFGAVEDYSTIKVQDYVDDVIAMSKYLAKRFGEEKIFLIGHSWGTIIGILAAQQRPDLFHAYVGVAQQVNSAENDSISYDIVMEGARRNGDDSVVEKLKENGYPPYTVEERGKYMYLLRRIYWYMPRGDDMGETDGLRLFRAREHNLLDRINIIRGLYAALDYVYPQLAQLDFIATASELQLPVYFMIGRYDYACVQSIAERYFHTLEAPKKELVWFERSGHNPCYEEADKFNHVMIEHVLPNHLPLPPVDIENTGNDIVNDTNETR
jgi:pimeloyl-ACP methyl ester carboxylesterase